MTPGRSRQKKRELEKERVKKIERVRSFWNQVKVKKKKKRRGCTNMGIRVWLTKCKRKKKKKETYGRKKRQRRRNHNLKIISQYFHNKFK